MGAIAPFIPAILSAVAGVGGAIYSSNAQQAAIDAQNQQQQAAMRRQRELAQQEDQRQEAMRKQQQAQVDQSLQDQQAPEVQQQLEDQQTKNSEQANVLTDAMAKLSPDEVGLKSRATGTEGATVVDDDLTKRLAQGASNVRDYAQAKSNINAYDQLFGNRARAYDRANEGITFLNKKREGSLQTAGIQNNYVGQSFGSSIVPDTSMGDILTGIGGAFSSAYG